MAIIATNTQKTEVQAIGKAMSAQVNFSGALMEMLATVYVYILMAGIREAIQNACDAARRNGHRFEDGVTVLLPTKSNPMITVVDRGSGMTKEFMEAEDGYLSFGSSTKAGDDGAAGGLGVGRWAAYGYIRECYISTCHASDMVERTYFQFQSDNSTPQVQLASEVPGSVVGTKVYFPVKESDIDEALRAVSWLKEVMQLTMRDSFAVDAPASLPQVLPEASGVVLDLGEQDPTLKGIKVYPMQGENLKYGRQGPQKGSLVVLSNQASGVGGLPFHVQGQNANSVFDCGMVVEIPMSFRVPFMPSREEVKYTDEVNSLMRAIDVAAKASFLATAGRLFAEQTLSSKLLLTNLMGSATENWHLFCKAARTDTPISADLRDATGRRNWTGALYLPVVPELRDHELVCKYVGPNGTAQAVKWIGGELGVSAGPDTTAPITFSKKAPMVLVVNDVKSRGLARFRSWAGKKNGEARFIFLGHKTDVAKAEAAAKALNSIYGGELKLVRTSSMPEFERTVVGSKVVAAKVRTGGLIYHCTTQRKQVSDTATVAEKLCSAPRRVWVGKQGARLGGFNEATQVGAFFQYGHSIEPILKLAGVTRLYLLSPKQEEELTELVSTLKKDGYWEMSDEELLEEEDGHVLQAAVKAARSWEHLEDVSLKAWTSAKVQDVVAGRKMQAVTDNSALGHLVRALASKPRMALTGSALDKELASCVDLLTGEVRMHRAAAIDAELRDLCQGLALVGGAMVVTTDDSKSRQELATGLVEMRNAGTIDYGVVRDKLTKQFPLLGLVKASAFTEDEGDELVKALAALYR